MIGIHFLWGGVLITGVRAVAGFVFDWPWLSPMLLTGVAMLSAGICLVALTFAFSTPKPQYKSAHVEHGSTAGFHHGLTMRDEATDSKFCSEDSMPTSDVRMPLELGVWLTGTAPPDSTFSPTVDSLARQLREEEGRIKEEEKQKKRIEEEKRIERARHLPGYMGPEWIDHPCTPPGWGGPAGAPGF
ncbi:hypothetical protein [Paramagnetospirillum caucaseum]|nr:hypothetical protein [Paramagnetospirillum caucaseum]